MNDNSAGPAADETTHTGETMSPSTPDSGAPDAGTQDPAATEAENPEMAELEADIA